MNFFERFGHVSFALFLIVGVLALVFFVLVAVRRRLLVRVIDDQMTADTEACTTGGCACPLCRAAANAAAGTLALLETTPGVTIADRAAALETLFVSARILVQTVAVAPPPETADGKAPKEEADHDGRGQTP